MSMAAEFEKDPSDWLRKLSPHEWIRAALSELKQAEAAYARRNARAAIVGCKRAAGMALNGVLIVDPRADWGRTYVEHVAALAQDDSVPDAVKRACRAVLDAQPPGSSVVTLRTPSSDAQVLEATRDVIAHAYAVVVKRGDT